MTAPEDDSLPETCAALLESGFAQLEGTISRQHYAPTEPGATQPSLPRLPRLLLAEPSRPAALAELHITGLLGVGGMGRVELASQPSLDRSVAVKRVRADIANRERACRTLLAEARVSGSLEHPNVVPVHTIGLDDEDLPALVMKRVDGLSWHELLSPGSEAELARLGARDGLQWHLEVLMQVCNAVHFAHSRGIVHRDIKPHNVMVGHFGEVYLLDWGIATALAGPRDERVVGTPAYLAPEMLLGGGPHITALTDVYLLGATLHHILTGRPPRAGCSLEEALRRARDSAPYRYPPSVPGELAALANRAMARVPDERPMSAAAFREAIADYLSHRSSVAISTEAAGRLDQLLALQPGIGSEDATRIGALFSEGCFGMRHALATWPGNDLARAGLQAALGWMVEHELALGNVGAAEALLADLPTPDAALARRVAEARARLVREGRELDRLRGLEREYDPRVSARERARWCVGLGLLIAALSALGEWYFPAGVGLTHVMCIIFGAVDWLVIVAVLVFSRRTMLATRINRQAWVAYALMSLACAAMHGVGALCSLPLVPVLAMDMLVLALVICWAASVFHRALLGAAALVPPLAFAMALWPRLLFWICGGGCLVGYLVAAAVYRFGNVTATPQSGRRPSPSRADQA
jgi:serine/threonine-protein kinase